MPRMKIEKIGGGDMKWLASTHGIGNAQTGTLKVSEFTKSTHYPNGFIPSGTAVDCADMKNLKPYTDGPSAVLGFLLTDQHVGNEKQIPAPVLMHGIVIPSLVPGGSFTVPTQGKSNGFVFKEVN